MTILRMKAYAEKKAIDEKINSEFITYVEKIIAK
jgi:hypothetical protein